MTSGTRAVGARTRGDFAHPRGSVRRTRGEARRLSLTDVRKIRAIKHDSYGKYGSGSVAHDGGARGGAHL